MMKIDSRKTLVMMAILTCIVIILSSYVAGPPPGTTNAPGEATCFSSPACHNAAPNTGGGFGELTMMGGVPTGNLYIPGKTYQIMPYVVDTGKVISGFEAVAVLDNGNSAGSANIILPTNTQLISSGGFEYIMQTSTGAVQPVMANLHDWMYEWVAPVAGSGTVTFYVAFIAADNNNGPSNDNIYTDTLILYEDTITVSQEELLQKTSLISVYPSPASDYIYVQSENDFDNTAKASIIDISGHTILNDIVLSKSGITEIDIRGLSSGLYLLMTTSSKQEASIERILIH